MMDAHPTKSMPMILVEFLIFVRNNGILAILVENGFFYNKVHTKPIEALKGNHYNGFKVIPISAGARKSIIVNLDAEILVNLLIRTPFHNIITIKSIPPNLGNPPKPLGGATTTVVQLVVPYFRPFRRPLNYPKCMKDFDPDVHVRIFKAIIKANDEIIDEEIASLFNFVLKDNTFDWCNNYMRDNPNCRFVDLEQAFYRHYQTM
jgi:hypothetical protein